MLCWFFFFFQAEDGIRDADVTGVQTCALPIYRPLGCRVTVTSGADGAAGDLPGNPAPLLLELLAGGGMRHPLDRVITMGDDRPLGADAKINPAVPVRLAGGAGWLGDQRLDRHDQPPPRPCS